VERYSQQWGLAAEIKPDFLARPELLKECHQVFATEKAYQEATTRNCLKCLSKGKK
jgi:hypothetical protein